ncbi:bifunctional nuclease family protein [Halocatena pleomorpha]|uniref:Bifunctional nuclease family protein n=1 Tax=Halocatena pleomorpha TaxID=1785090 RepID=A0A3P3RIX9_9EURY|nr:bifunctional nuclease family protein [Halocatena pleomorpha]RRJ33507.1 bifunctional nuclease family protein [Halocatena pleomorpha]
MNASIEGVRVAGTQQGAVPVVTLASDDEDETDLLPIFIGFSEATSIVRGLDADTIGRPLTHDLLLDGIEELGGRVDRVAITAVEDGTYFADLHLDTPRESVVIDSRPSDALALAARTNAPIEIAPEVFDGGGDDPEQYLQLHDIREVIDGSSPDVWPSTEEEFDE